MTRILNRQLILSKGLRIEHPVDTTIAAHNAVIKDTNGTTAVNVFGANGAPANLTITSVDVIALDTTAGNITPKVNGNTVVTIAKGTASGALVGGVTLANTTVKAGDAVTILSSSAGNARVRIHYTFDTA